MSTWTYSSTQEAKLMKVKYGKLIDKQFNEENVLFARIKIMEDFEGSQIEFPVIQSIGGGVSAGSLGTASKNINGKVTITSKKLYAVVSVDRESMKAARSDEGAFVRFTKHPVQIATRSFNRNLERIITRGDATGSGALAVGDAATNVSGNGTSGNPYIVTLASDSVMASFEEGDILNYDTEVTELEVTAVDETAKTLSLVGTSAGLAALSGTGPVPANKAFYMQKSKDNEPIGIKGVLEATSGSLYGISVGRRWKAYVKDASSAALSTDLMNDVVINLKKQCGKAPKLALSSYKQYLAALNLMEDQKRYNVPARRVQFSFEALEIMTPEGPIPMIASRFVDDDQIYFLNDDHIELHLRPGGFQWFDEDGTVFLREASADSYEARYGGYGQLFVNPHFQGLLDNLA